MGSISSLHHGTISAKPFHHETGRIDGRHGNRITGTHQGGSLHGAGGVRGGSIHGNSGGSLQGEIGESPQNRAMAEIGGLISSLGSLSNQAQSLPLNPPSLQAQPQNQPYQPQPIDYAFNDGSN